MKKGSLAVESSTPLALDLQSSRSEGSRKDLNLAKLAGETSRAASTCGKDEKTSEP